MKESEVSVEELDPERLQKISSLIGLSDEPISLTEDGRDRFGGVKNVINVEKETGLIYSKGNNQFAIKIPRQIATLAEIDHTKNKIVFSVTIKRDSEGKMVKKLTAEMI